MTHKKLYVTTVPEDQCLIFWLSESALPKNAILICLTQLQPEPQVFALSQQQPFHSDEV